jgi:hypothetical protein
LTASTALALNASKEVVSVTNTGTGDNVLATAPTLVGDVTLSTGNLVIGTSGKGIDFSATVLAQAQASCSMTMKKVLGHHSSGAGLTFSGASGTYTKIGRQVTVNGQLSFPATASAADIAIGGLPFTVGTFSVGTINNADVVFTITSSTVFYIYDVAGVRKTNVNYSGVTIYFTIAYFV